MSFTCAGIIWTETAERWTARLQLRMSRLQKKVRRHLQTVSTLTTPERQHPDINVIRR